MTTTELSRMCDQRLQDYCGQVDADALAGDETALERGELAVQELDRRKGRT